MRIITICREYGAGGHSVGQRVADELGIELYDKDIISGSAEKLGIDPDSLAAGEETITRKDAILRGIIPMSYDQKDAMFEAQTSVILKLAEEGPCLILGRCGNWIMQAAGIPSLNVFLFADEEHREKRVGELIGSEDPAAIRRAMKKNDQSRHAYYTHYTGLNWGNPKDFHLLLDSGKLGYDTCVKLICQAARDLD